MNSGGLWVCTPFASPVWWSTKSAADLLAVSRSYVMLILLRALMRDDDALLDNVAADHGLEIEPHVAIVPTHEPPAAVALDHLVLVERVVVVRSTVAPPSGLLDGPPRRRAITIDRYATEPHR